MSPATHRGSGKCSRCSHWRFRLDGLGFEPRWWRNCLFPSPFRPCQGEHRAPCSINNGSKAAGAWRWPPTPSNAEVNPLTPNDPYCGRTPPLTSKRCILYIYSTNIGTVYFKDGIHSSFISLQNAVWFIILTYLVPILFTFYIQGVLKLKKIIPVPKTLTVSFRNEKAMSFLRDSKRTLQKTWTLISVVIHINRCVYICIYGYESQR
jgi:hypothetical protein